MKKFLILLFISMMLLTGGHVFSKEINTKLVGKVIILDAGHGGKDRGTSESSIFESDINLSIVLKLKAELIKQGVDVLLTRDGDYDLSSTNTSRRKKSDFDNRIRLINDSQADLYISIHMNYLTDKQYYGGQVFYTNGNEKLANVMQESFVKKLKSPREAKLLNNSIYMFKQLKVPGVLIECGFLSNDNERYLLHSDDYQNKIVDTIIEGLIKYY